MSAPYTVAVLVGSLRKAAFSRKMALAAEALAPGSLKCQIVEIGDLALYNEDVEAAGAPASWVDPEDVRARVGRQRAAPGLA